MRHRRQPEMASINEHIIDLSQAAPSPVLLTVQEASRDETSNNAAYKVNGVLYFRTLPMHLLSPSYTLATWQMFVH